MWGLVPPCGARFPRVGLGSPVWGSVPLCGDTHQRALLRLSVPPPHLLDGVLPLPQQLLPLLVGLAEVLCRLVHSDLRVGVNFNYFLDMQPLSSITGHLFGGAFAVEACTEMTEPRKMSVVCMCVYVCVCVCYLCGHCLCQFIVQCLVFLVGFHCLLFYRQSE